MAAGIIEKDNRGLFENEIELVGKYAKYARFLKEDLGLFKTFRELYITAVATGFLFNRKEEGTNDDKSSTVSIFAADLIKKKADLRFLYGIIMIAKDEESYSIEDYMNRAFRNDIEDETNAKRLKENMSIFNSYACGGIEYLYEKFERCRNKEDTVEKLYELLKKTAEDSELLSIDDKVKFERDFN